MVDAGQVAVVGAGLMGSATAFQLARRGVDVVLLERTRPAAADGSSHGSARIFRYAYEDPFWVRLVQRAADGYAELERLSGQRLLTPTGALDRGALRRPAHLADVLEECGVEYELLTGVLARDRWPHAVDGAETGPVLWHPGAAVLDAERAVQAQVALAEQHGARLLTGWELASAEPHGAGQRLTSTDGRVLDVGAVVVAAGGWLPHLLGRLGLPAGAVAALPPLAVTQEQAFHFPYDQQQDDGGGWPATVHHAPEALVYSLPGGRDAGHRGQKVAQMNGGRLIPSALAQDGVVDPGNRTLVVEHVQRHLPGLVPQPYAETTCLFTSTPTEDFVVDRVGGTRTVLVSACSGHGAKLAPVVGEAAADVVLGGERVARFRARGITV